MEIVGVREVKFVLEVGLTQTTGGRSFPVQLQLVEAMSRVSITMQFAPFRHRLDTQTSTCRGGARLACMKNLDRQARRDQGRRSL